MRRFVCIHGHFYQPPREDPRTREIGREPSAAPYHDWNERIAAECYGPNSASPLVDDQGKILEVVNNYARMSFDFGPTLLRWLESNYTELYQTVLGADRESVGRFSGHGSAMAQAYSHMILPLASPEDKRTQVRWGAEDFERRFGRYPEGMWLPETAVDVDTLEALADAGIRFTVLSPRQAMAVRTIGERDWHDVSGGGVGTRRAYSYHLPSGRSISLFFYDDGISDKIAFGDLLLSGVRIAKALLSGFSESDEPQLVNVASDGETYGHHHKNGNLALSRAFSEVERSGSASLANYALFLSLSPPESEVRLTEPSAWSCSHGVERWRSDCGCGSEIRPGFNQQWRSPLRLSLDWLRDRLVEVYSAEGARIFGDKDAAREGLGSSGIGTDLGSRDYVVGELKAGSRAEEAKRGAKLLEMVEWSALMYSSCAWFWEDIARPETRQMLRYAARAMELAKELSGVDLSPGFSQRLGKAVPNTPGFDSGPKLFFELLRESGTQ
jgi:alpha-amylase/alpha-mannosidase (GH57 family)